MAARRDDGVDVCLATSHGGHMELLAAVEPAYAARSHAFVTPPSVQARALRERGVRVVEVANPRRSPLALARTVAQSLRAARALRPRVVVSAGAGAAVPFCLAAKLLGARLVFVETMARVRDGSLSGRLLYPFADRFIVQWPELRDVYPRAEVCRPALLEPRPRAAGQRGRGTFVAAGTHGQPFDRLLRLADEAVARGLLPRPLVAQAGAAAYRPRTFQAVATLAPGEVERAVRGSEVVLCHGGSGLVSLAVRSGKTPLVLPRRREHGEHVDDHQVTSAAKLADVGVAISLERTPLDQAIALARRPVAPAPVAGPRLADRLTEIVEAWL